MPKRGPPATAPARRFDERRCLLLSTFEDTRDALLIDACALVRHIADAAPGDSTDFAARVAWGVEEFLQFFLDVRATPHLLFVRDAAWSAHDACVFAHVTQELPDVPCSLVHTAHEAAAVMRRLDVSVVLTGAPPTIDSVDAVWTAVLALRAHAALLGGMVRHASDVTVHVLHSAWDDEELVWKRRVVDMVRAVRKYGDAAAPTHAEGERVPACELLAHASGQCVSSSRATMRHHALWCAHLALLPEMPLDTRHTPSAHREGTLAHAVAALRSFAAMGDDVAATSTWDAYDVRVFAALSTHTPHAHTVAALFAHVATQHGEQVASRAASLFRLSAGMCPDTATLPTTPQAHAARTPPSPRPSPPPSPVLYGVGLAETVVAEMIPLRADVEAWVRPLPKSQRSALRRFVDDRHWHSNVPIQAEDKRRGEASAYMRQRLAAFWARYSRSLLGGPVRAQTIAVASGGAAGEARSSARAKKAAREIARARARAAKARESRAAADAQARDAAEQRAWKDVRAAAKREDDVLARAELLCAWVESEARGAKYVQKALVRGMDALHRALTAAGARTVERDRARMCAVRLVLSACASAKTDELPSARASAKTDELPSARASAKTDELPSARASAKTDELPERAREVLARLGVGAHDTCNGTALSSFQAFQLEHLGALLPRPTGVPDARVRSGAFAPDPWQRRLMDVVDAHESALVVAPTSSGKTFIAYYAIEQVLREGDDGLVVFVAPTKPLVNQVFAEVTARFAKTYARPGRTLAGVFTSDYRHDEETCQVLVTVPQCLEILLLSPVASVRERCASIRRVLFDEVHHIGTPTHSVWERCIAFTQAPFLALSATLEEPRPLLTWMRAHRPDSHVHLVPDPARGEPRIRRFNDLLVHTSAHGSTLTALHPLADLNLSQVRLLGAGGSACSMAPCEALRLFHAMATHNADVPLPVPDASPWPVRLTRDAVHAWSDALLGVLGTMSDERLGKVIATLSSGPPPHPPAHGDMEDAVFSLACTLRERDMLPALFFRLSTEACEAYARSVVGRLDAANKTAAQQTSAAAQLAEAARLVAVLRKQEAELCARMARKSSSEAEHEADLRRVRGQMAAAHTRMARLRTRHTFAGSASLDAEEQHELDVLFAKRVPAPYHWMLRAFRLGVGVHHAGLPSVVRRTVEQLFRRRVLTVVFCTTTLAYGLNMPCRTAVFVGSSLHLTSLVYRQAAGRAGRRGLDDVGHVVLLAVPPKRQRILRRLALPVLRPGFPLSFSIVLRIVLATQDTLGPPPATLVHGVARLLATPLLHELLPRAALGAPRTIQAYFRLAISELVRSGLLAERSLEPLGWARLIAHLSWVEPANFDLVEIFTHHAAQALGGSTAEDAMRTLVHLIASVYACRPLPPMPIVPGRSPSLARLPPLPKPLRKQLCARATARMAALGAFCMASGVPTTGLGALPLSHRAAGSGAWCDAQHGVARRVRLFTPLVPGTHAGTALPLNSYVLDYFKHGQGATLRRDNGVLRGDAWEALRRTVLLVSELRYLAETCMAPAHADTMRAVAQLVWAKWDAWGQ